MSLADTLKNPAQRSVEAWNLLKELIARPSVSRNEGAVADYMEQFLQQHGVPVQRLGNNLWVRNLHFAEGKPTVLLNSHLDTVRPAAGWSYDPYTPTEADGRLYGLGANDAGASVVSLTEAFLALYSEELPYNLILALSAEEECMGEGGIRGLLPLLGYIDMGIVGEPTGMQAAVAERGLVVLDCTAHGRSGHAARNEGINALYIALEDIERIRNHRFERESALLGPIRMTVTQISAGTQHNVVPAECRFVVDIRTTDAYTNEETVEEVRRLVQSEVQPRSTRIRAAVIEENHPLVRAAVATGCTTFVSPTTSDRTLMPFKTLKIGPGESARSHTADEYIRPEEIGAGIEGYLRLLQALTYELTYDETLG